MILIAFFPVIRHKQVTLHSVASERLSDYANITTVVFYEQDCNRRLSRILSRSDAVA